MNSRKKTAIWKPKPIRVEAVFRIYAVTVGVFGLMLLSWGPTWFGGKLAGVPFGGATLARVFGSMFMALAACATALSAVDNARERHRGLFWFAMGHMVLWLVVFRQLIWGWGPGLGDQMVAALGTIAFLLFALWLTADGEFPNEPFGVNGILGPPAPAPSEPLRSQYEQKIRQAAAQEERNRLARDLHDSIKQQIFAIQTSAATAQTRLTGDASGAREALDQIRSAAREAMTEMEVMLDQLRAEPLENTGLVEALKKLCESIGFRTGAQVEFKLGLIPDSGQMAPGAAEATLRVAQEALANVARHARASHVVVSLDSAGDRMDLSVKDDGAGFDSNEDSRGMGTANMRTRAEELGGQFELATRPGEGTTMKFSIPCRGLGPDATEMRRRYRNKSISIGLFILGFLFNSVMHHWTVAPALAFIAAIAAGHYLKTYARVRRLSQPLL
jgi:signal transduction histidine kinase